LKERNGRKSKAALEGWMLLVIGRPGLAVKEYPKHLSDDQLWHKNVRLLMLYFKLDLEVDIELLLN
jgi:hypothetical protein